MQGKKKNSISADKKFLVELAKRIFRESQFSRKPFRRLRHALPAAKKKWLAMSPKELEM
jgi:hypothetical protein